MCNSSAIESRRWKRSATGGPLGWRKRWRQSTEMLVRVQDARDTDGPCCATNWTSCPRSTLKALSILVVGGQAVNDHDRAATTRTISTYLLAKHEPMVSAVFGRLQISGHHLRRVTAQISAIKPKQYFQIGVPPERVDVLQSIAAVAFEDAWKRAKTVRRKWRSRSLHLALKI